MFFTGRGINDKNDKNDKNFQSNLTLCKLDKVQKLESRLSGITNANLAYGHCKGNRPSTPNNFKLGFLWPMCMEARLLFFQSSWTIEEWKAKVDLVIVCGLHDFDEEQKDMVVEWLLCEGNGSKQDKKNKRWLRGNKLGRHYVYQDCEEGRHSL